MTHRQRVWTLLHEKQQIKPGLLIFGCDCYTFVNSKKKKKTALKSSFIAHRALAVRNIIITLSWTPGGPLRTLCLCVCLLVSHLLPQLQEFLLKQELNRAVGFAGGC